MVERRKIIVAKCSHNNRGEAMDDNDDDDKDNDGG
jgi:hypothetical protein